MTMWTNLEKGWEGSLSINPTDPMEVSLSITVW